MVLAILGTSIGGCGSSDGPARTAFVSGTTANVVAITEGDRRKLYVPQIEANSATGNATISVIDLDTPTDSTTASPALIATIDLGYSDPVTAIDGNPSAVVAISGATGRVYEIDPARDTVRGSFVIPAGYRMAFGEPNVSGIALNPDRNSAVLAMWNGFAMLDLVSGEIVHVIDAPPSSQFAFDWSRQLVVAPFSACTSHLDSRLESLPICGKITDEAGNVMQAGVTVVDTNAAVAYTYQDSGAPSTAAPLGSGAYAAAIDQRLGRAVVSSVGEHAVDIGAAEFDPYRRYVIPPPTQFAMAADVTGTTTVDATTHTALFGTSDGFAMADLSAVSMAPLTYKRAVLPPLPGRGLPVDEMIVTRDDAGEPPLVVLVSADRTLVAKVDLVQLLAQPVIRSTTYPDEFEVMPDGLAATVSYLAIVAPP